MAAARCCRSLVVTFCLWFAWWLATRDAWPSGAIAFLLWAARHFAFEGPAPNEERLGMKDR